MPIRGSESKVAPRRGAVALSGGVDSAVAAHLLQQEGWSVFGITMQLGDEAADLSHLAEQLGIEIAVLDLRSRFESAVITYFCQEYERGRTPNPCVVCNQSMKFGYLAEYAREMGATFLATGHYARRRYDPQRQQYALLKARCPDKDQSYMLYGLSPEQIDFACFPLGDYSKKEVRKVAAQAGLSVAQAGESQDICFIDGDYREFLHPRIPNAFRPGPIIDRWGQRLGSHRGLAGYTIGQRRGLEISAHRPLYVIEVDVQRNALVVGTVEETLASGFIAYPYNYLAESIPVEGLNCTVKVRYRASEEVCHLQATHGHLQATFAQPQRAVTPGQSAVFFRGDEVLGGGIIQRTCMAAPR